MIYIAQKGCLIRNNGNTARHFQEEDVLAMGNVVLPEDKQNRHALRKSGGNHPHKYGG